MQKEVKEERYHLLHPRMAVLVTSIDMKGNPNVMSCAWSSPVSEEPPIIMICLAKGAYTSKLIRTTKQFAVNIPSEKILKEVLICGKYSGRDTDKFEKSKLKTKKAQKVKVSVLADCIGTIECKLMKVVSAGECYAFFGEVVYASADSKYFKTGSWTKSARIPYHVKEKNMTYFG